MSKIFKLISGEPAVMSALVGIVAWAALLLLDVIEAAGGESATVLLTLLGAAGVTRQRVTPVE